MNRTIGLIFVVISMTTGLIGCENEVVDTEGLAQSTKALTTGTTYLFVRKDTTFAIAAPDPAPLTRTMMWELWNYDYDQQMKFVSAGSGNYLIKRSHSRGNNNYCLNAHAPRRGSRVNMYKCSTRDSDQHFRLRRAGNYYMLQRSGTNLCLNAYRPRDGSNLNLWSCNSQDDDQLFSILTIAEAEEIQEEHVSIYFQERVRW